MNRKNNMDNKIKVISELTKYGLNDYVGVSIHKMPNDRGQMTLHMRADWSETTITPDGYDKMPTNNIEEINRYFNAELFVNGIIQRADWIKADHKDCVAYLTENPFGHPALFPVWLKPQKVIA